jgi:predicted O-methyltransferase YrrM
MQNIYDQLIIPEERRATSIRRDQAEYIFEFLKARPINRTLETGFAYGCSTAHIMAATAAPHIAVDAYEEGYENLGLANITRMGLQHRLQFIRLPSHVALPRLLADGVAVDFAFIDGGHKFEEIFIDWYYISHLLNRNGCVMFDDSWLEATQMVVDFIRRNRPDFREIAVPIGQLYLFEKIAKDKSDWKDFRPFSTERGAPRASGRG